MIHAVPAEAREPSTEHIDAVRRRVRYLLTIHTVPAEAREPSTEYRDTVRYT